MEITSVFDILELYKTTFKKDDVLSAKENKKWKKHSRKDLLNNTDYVSYGLLALGLTNKDKVEIIEINRPEWNFIN